MRRRSRVGIALSAVAVLGSLPAAAAAQNAVFSITPASRQPYFIFAGAPGAVIRSEVQVVNVSPVSGRATLYAADATTGQTSGAVYASEQAQPSMVGSWIKLGTRTVALGPHQATRVRFTVEVPPGAQGGQYLGGLVVAPVRPARTSTSRHGHRTFHVNIEEIGIVGVQINLPGALVPKLELGGVRAAGRPGYQTLLVSLADAGNTLLKGAGRIEVSRGGRPVLTRAFALDTMVPHTNIGYPVYVRGRRLVPGRYTATVSLTYTGARTVRGQFTFVISAHQVRQTYGTVTPAAVTGARASSSTSPWLLGIGGLALVSLGIAGSSLYHRRRGAPRS